MRILSNFFGKRKTFGFNKGYDTKHFYQRIEVENDDCAVKLVNMFTVNEKEDALMNEYFNGFKQYIRVNWGDGSITHTDGVELINTGKYNTSGRVFTHTFKKAGIYTIDIESVEDLIVVNENFNYNEFQDVMDPCDGLELRTIGIGGKIHKYIPPTLERISKVEANIDKVLDKVIESNNFHRTFDLEYVSSQGSDVMGNFFPSSWCLTVQYLESLISPLEITQKFKEENVNGLVLNYDCFFAKWCSFTHDSLAESLSEKVDQTLYNMFHYNIESLSLIAFFAHSKDLHLATNGFNISELIKKYVYDYVDYSKEDQKARLCNLKFLMWNIKCMYEDGTIDLNTMNDHLDFFDVKESLKTYPDLFKGMFGMMEPNFMFYEPFSFRYIFTDTLTGDISSKEYVIDNKLDMRYMFLRANIYCVPSLSFEDTATYNPESTNFDINLKGMFMLTNYDYSEGGDVAPTLLQADQTLSFIPVPSLKDGLEGKFNLNLNMDAMFLESGNFISDIHPTSEKPKRKSRFTTKEGDISGVSVSLLDNTIPITGTGKGNREINISAKKMFGGSKDLNFSYTVDHYRVPLDFYRVQDLGEVHINSFITFNQDFTSMFESILDFIDNNRICEMYVEDTKFYLDYKPIINTEGLTVNEGYTVLTAKVIYNKIFKSVDIMPFNFGVECGLLNPIGVKFFEKYPDSNIDSKLYRCALYCDEMLMNADYHTKEICSEFVKPSNKLTEVMRDDRKYISTLSSETEYKGVSPIIVSAIRAFANDYDMVKKYYGENVGASTHGLLRSREEYPEYKPTYRDNVYGLNISEYMFYDRNYDSNADLTEMFMNNISMEVKYEYTHNTSFKLNIDSGKKCIGMFKISDEINLKEDRDSGFKISEYGYTPEEVYPQYYDNILKYYSKHGYIFDYFRVFKFENMLNDLTKLTDVEFNTKYANIKDMFKNRVSLTYLAKMFSIYNVNEIDNIEVLDNTGEVFRNEFSPLFNKIMPTFIMRNFDKFMGLGVNLSDYHEDEMNFTRNYSMVIQHFKDNTVKGDISFSLKPITSNELIFRGSELYEGNKAEIEKAVNKKSVTVTIEIESVSYVHNYTFDIEKVPYEEIPIEAIKGIKANIIEVRTYVKRPYTEEVDETDTDLVSHIPISKVGEDILHNAYFTSLSSGDLRKVFSNCETMLAKKPELHLFKDINLSYLVPHSYAFIKSIWSHLSTGNKLEIVIHGDSNKSDYFGLRDSLDIFYTSDFMTESNEQNRSMVCRFESKVDNVYILRNNDLKLSSYFNAVDNLDFTNTLRLIEGDGLIHNDYLLEDALLSKTVVMNNWFDSPTSDKSNLISIRGSLTSIGRVSLNEKMNIKPLMAREGTKKTARFILNKFFSPLEDPVSMDIYINPNFLQGLSFLNSHRYISSLCCFNNVFTNYNPLDKDMFGSSLKGNIFNGSYGLFENSFKSPTYKMGESLDDYNKDNLVILYKDLNYNNEDDLKEVNNNELFGYFTKSLPVPHRVRGDKFKNIIFRSPANVGLLGIEDPTSKQSINFNKIFSLSGSKPIAVDHFLFKVKLDTDSKTYDVLTNIPKDSNVNSDYRNHMNLKSNYDGIEVGIPTESLDSNVPENDNVALHYQTKLIFNKNAKKSINLTDINRMIYNNLENYGCQLDGFKINHNSDIKIKFSTKDNNDVQEKTFKVSRGVYHKFQPDLFIRELEVVATHNPEYENRFIEIDFKTRIQKSMLPVNNDFFRNKVFIKDNNDTIFEMLQLKIKKKKNLEPSIPDDPYWHINIVQSSLSRNKTLNEVLKSRLYQGEVIFTTSFIVYDNILEAGFFKDNTIAINVPMAQEEILIYAICDSPFSLYNSDGEVVEIYGNSGFDILSYIDPSTTNGVLNLYPYLSELTNSNHCDYLSIDHFDNTNSVANLTNKFKVSFGSFIIKNFHLSIISDFGEYCSGIYDSFNSREVPYRLIGSLRRKSDSASFEIISSFNGVLDEVGVNMLDRPFRFMELNKIENSFNIFEKSINKFFPEDFLNSYIYQDLTITQSFNGIFCPVKMRSYNTDAKVRHNIICTDSFNNSILQPINSKYGKYTLNYLLSISNSNSLTLNDNTKFRTTEEFKAELNSLKQYISNNKLEKDVLNNNLESSKINTSLEIL